MTLREEIQAIVKAVPAALTERKDLFSFSYVVAERKAFLCKQKLVYSAKIRIDDLNKELHFSEMLKETGFGLGGGNDGDTMSPGLGFRKSVYKTGLGPRLETIEELSSFFGKKYSYTFAFALIRERIKAAATNARYRFVYKLIQ
ncbi:MAG TPA: hypothetical protein DDY20_02505 [Desulfobulbaceae bacterium]|nr:hypothetical protein [Desulfobulbaceae bacterium]